MTIKERIPFALGCGVHSLGLILSYYGGREVVESPYKGYAIWCVGFTACMCGGLVALKSLAELSKTD